MVLQLERIACPSPREPGETDRPRSLRLALSRMGFRDLPDAAQPALAGGGWRLGTGDDPAPDWQPL